ncbi:MAG: hypothetical protein ACXAC8_02210 [Candidatus Hodarchaeales archaeon]
MIAIEILLGMFFLVIFTYLIAVFGGALFVKLSLKLMKVSLDKNNTGGLPKAGAFVGMLERAIVLTFGLLGEYGAISFVFAAKSMARFKQLENRQFAEYYLIGTLLSFFFALIIAIVAHLIFILFFLPLIPEDISIWTIFSG